MILVCKLSIKLFDDLNHPNPWIWTDLFHSIKGVVCHIMSVSKTSLGFMYGHTIPFSYIMYVSNGCRYGWLKVMTMVPVNGNVEPPPPPPWDKFNQSHSTWQSAVWSSEKCYHVNFTVYLHTHMWHATRLPICRYVF